MSVRPILWACILGTATCGGEGGEPDAPASRPAAEAALTPREDAPRRGRSVFGEGGTWDAEFAARQFEKFHALKPDPQILARIEALEDNSWLTLTPRGDESPEHGRGETPWVYMPDVKAFAFICGCTDPGYSSDTWFYSPSANQWVQMWPNWIKGTAGATLNRGPIPRDRPAGRCSLGLTYDPDHKRLVNIGGANAGNFGKITYALDVATNRWSELSGPDKPKPGRGGDNVFGYAPGYGAVEVVPRGKLRLQQPRLYEGSETWVFRTEPKQWERVNVKTEAPGTHNVKMVWNSVDRKLIMNTGVEIWAFDPAKQDWEDLTPEETGPGRYRHGDAYDPFNNVLLTFGGYLPRKEELWAFDFATRTWKRMESPDMPKGANSMFDFDTDLNVCVMKSRDKISLYRFRRAPAAAGR
ncbi:MAG: kelch repeat-containing protein [Planctomycetales bacterium]